MRILIFAISLLIFSNTQSTAQSNIPTGALSDTLLIEPGQNGVALLPYKILPKQTVYSISQYFDCKADLLYSSNPVVKVKGLQVGETIYIPVLVSTLSEAIPPKATGTYLPIYYRIKEKETMYRLTKVHFQVTDSYIMKINNMKTSQLNNGQLILLGYMKVNPALPAPQVVQNIKATPAGLVSTPEPRKQKQDLIVKDFPKTATTPVRDLLKDEKEPETIVADPEEDFKKPGVKYRTATEKGVAFWHKESRLTKGYFVLHPTAAINSIMTISNSLTGKTVRAKVVGNIPPNSYPKDILIIVSPQVAQELGAFDARFFAKLKYTAEVHPDAEFNN